MWKRRFFLFFQNGLPPIFNAKTFSQYLGKCINMNTRDVFDIEHLRWTPYQSSKMDLFAKIVNGSQLLNIFAKALSWIFNKILKTPLKTT